MEKAKVYFADFRTALTENLQQKLTRLMKAAGMDSIDFDKRSPPSKFTSVSRATLRFCVRTGQKRSRTSLRSAAASRS